MEDLANWQPCAAPEPKELIGNHLRLTAYKPADAQELWACFGGTDFNDLAKYFPNPNYQNAEEFGAWLDASQGALYTMVFRELYSNAAIGMASYMRLDAANGCVEVGAVCHAPSIQRSIAATEAHYLMAKHIFDGLGYRRYEWKLHNDNAPSHISAKRFGFTFEGIFRNHMVSKGANRDTAWYAMTNQDWPTIKYAFEAWLAPANFDKDKKQIKRLQDFRKTGH